MTTEEDTLFEKLADALWSWVVNTSGDKTALWWRKYDIRLLMSNNGLSTIVKWLEYRKTPDYARAFEEKFEQLCKSSDDFYDELIQGKLDEDRARHERIQLLEDEAKQLAEHVQEVKYFCLNDLTIRRQFVDDEAAQNGEGKKKKHGAGKLNAEVQNRLKGNPNLTSRELASAIGNNTSGDAVRHTAAWKEREEERVSKKHRKL